MSALKDALNAQPPPPGHFSVAQVKSSIGAKPKARATLRALGLGRIGKRNTLADRPELRGMLRKVAHLVLVTEPATEPSTATATTATESDES